MSLERTQHQSSNEINESKKLSLEPTRPPASIPGYRLLTFLGSGAFGEVWSANDLKTGRKVAIKFYTRGSSSDIALLAGEVEKLALLGADRYVVQLLNVGWDATPPYYVMDYLERGSLEDLLSNQQTLPAREATELFSELATGMMHMHNKGILHCDLKPGNVMLDQEGRPRIGDFGQSRLSNGDTAALGTLFYMAPEQADLTAVPDARWDVYALGAIFYSMLIGKPPYYTPELAKQIEKSGDIDGRLSRYKESLLAAPKPVDHRALHGVDGALAEIIDNCIATNPHHRFENIASILVSLRQREIAKARKPLMILGLVGPLLLISLMSIFGWLAFKESVNQTQKEITTKAVESNGFAAKLAARSAAEQIDSYFRAVNQLVEEDSDFKAALFDVLDDADFRKLSVQIADPRNNEIDYRDPAALKTGLAREEIRKHAKRGKLQPFIEKRLNDSSGKYPVASSWFVSDRLGNQIASAFRLSATSETLGKNYSYRSYFTGLDTDLPINPPSENKSEDQWKSIKEESEDASAIFERAYEELSKRTIISKPHLSAAFVSKQSNSWKVAFSVPVIRNRKVVAVVAVTVDLGNFIDFENVKDHYAMLIDDRPGENRGLVLEHPLFQSVLSQHEKLPQSLARCIVDVDQLRQKSLLQNHADEKDILFRDPVGADTIGKEYDRESIFGIADVMLLKSYEGDPWKVSEAGSGTNGSDSTKRNEAAAKRPTGLVVIAVEDYKSVVAPASNLVYQWGRLAAIALAFLITVSVAMWYFVKRLLQESRERLERAFSPSSTETSSFRLKETIAAIDPEKPTEG